MSQASNARPPVRRFFYCTTLLQITQGSAASKSYKMAKNVVLEKNLICRLCDEHFGPSSLLLSVSHFTSGRPVCDGERRVQTAKIIIRYKDLVRCLCDEELCERHGVWSGAHGYCQHRPRLRSHLRPQVGYKERAVI